MKTIKQIADEIGVSKTAVRKKLTEDIRNRFAKTIGNTVYISEQGETLLKSAFPNHIENHVSGNQTETVCDLVSTLKSENDMLKSELSIKNQQITDLSSALVSAQEQAAINARALETAQQSYLAEQALHAEAIKRIGGTETPANESETEEYFEETETDLQKNSKNRGLFGLFRRKL
ncbi:MAG: hypothetical protein LBC71_03435 [Oscillospiraceae bacterium]|jgi:predicted ribonuclease YlaK|nr:hypothetical protein [Oscillospiraceae bacterium]